MACRAGQAESPRVLDERLHGSYRLAMESYTWQPARLLGYCSPLHVRTDFSNSPPSQATIPSGGTYVSVGFNDLRVLLDATWLDESSRVRFVGIDLNAIAVAKSSVIAEMLRDEAIPAHHVVQVWYSSTWSRPALASFKKALSDVKPWPKGSEVKRVLDFWKGGQPLELSQARGRWLDYFVGDERKPDGPAAASRYFVTGDLYNEQSAEQPEMGSMTMWLPAGFPPLHNADSIFATLRVEDYLPAMNQQGARINIVQLFVQGMLTKMSRVREHFVHGRLQVEFWQEAVTPSNEKLMQRISALSPLTMTWSNVLDFMGFAEFHHMASTWHYGYSMDWVKDVYGICLADWSRDGRQARRASILAELDDGKLLQSFAKETGLQRCLTLPGYGCPSRFWMYVMAMRLHAEWVKHFVKTSITGPGECLHLLWYGMGLPFIMHRRFPTNLYLKWSYEVRAPEIGEAIQTFKEQCSCFDKL